LGRQDSEVPPRTTKSKGFFEQFFESKGEFVKSIGETGVVTRSTNLKEPFTRAVCNKIAIVDSLTNRLKMQKL